LKVLSEHPERVDMHGRIAEIYLQTGHPSRARDELETLLNNSIDDDLLYSASILLANVEGEAEAEGRLRQLIVAFPNRYEAYYSTAHLLFEQGDYTGVLETVEQCLQSVSPIDGEAVSRLYTLSGVASARIGEYDDAARFFSEALDHDRGNEIAAINRKLVQEYPF
jgi:tetratricopeptide (TPR) repeat protein